MLTEVIMFGNIMLFSFAFKFLLIWTILFVLFTLAVFVIALFMEYESFKIIETFIFLNA